MELSSTPKSRPFVNESNSLARAIALSLLLISASVSSACSDTMGKTGDENTVQNDTSSFENDTSINDTSINDSGSGDFQYE